MDHTLIIYSKSEIPYTGINVPAKCNKLFSNLEMAFEVADIKSEYTIDIRLASIATPEPNIWAVPTDKVNNAIDEINRYIARTATSMNYYDILSAAELFVTTCDYVYTKVILYLADRFGAEDMLNIYSRAFAGILDGLSPDQLKVVLGIDGDTNIVDINTEIVHIYSAFD